MNDAVDPFRALRLIHVAILLGALCFGVVVFVVRMEGMLGELGGEELRIVAWVAAGSVVALAPAAMAVRATLFGRVREAKDGELALVSYRAGWLAGLAILEGCVIFNLIAWLLVGDVVLNGGVAVVVWLLMVFMVPSRDHYDSVRRT